MDRRHAQGQGTRKRYEQGRRELREQEWAEREAQIATLRQVRKNPKSSPGEKLRAVELLRELEKQGYFYL